ncbi:hypothetical protein DF196_11810 [Bifidobacterium callitrichidarum]|uniref:Uncharacterized protein n=2 Tax=Bifidobacterium callitrichidarum TaxID=2052941 RepID=A0A2U2N0P4_9BIFI|nr:hypothetical protein DF196_11810 [Bifidobacterium callitrichidarum]
MCTAADGGTLWKAQLGNVTHIQWARGDGWVLHYFDSDKPFYGSLDVNVPASVTPSDSKYGGIILAKYSAGYSRVDNEMLIRAVTGTNVGTNEGILTIKTNNGVPSTTHAVYKTALLDYTKEREVTLKANGGAFSDKSDTRTAIINLSDMSKLSDTPTRDGWFISDWNTKADRSGTSASVLAETVDKATATSDGFELYAQWDRDKGKPSLAYIDCSTESNTVRCAISIDYPNAESTTRELTAVKGSKLSWGQLGGISGVRLDNTGYKARASCVAENGCYWVSLDESSNNSNMTVQMPTTGAPEGLSLIGATAAGFCLIGLVTVAVKRSRM